MANHDLVFTISWQGASKATLHFVIDNDKVVATDDDDLTGNSPITHRYSTTSAAIHVVEWSLWFPGKTLKKLVATLSIDGGEPVTLDSKKDDTKNKWSSRGAAP